jgi:hypothetical protein
VVVEPGTVEVDDVVVGDSGSAVDESAVVVDVVEEGEEESDEPGAGSLSGFDEESTGVDGSPARVAVVSVGEVTSTASTGVSGASTTSPAATLRTPQARLVARAATTNQAAINFRRLTPTCFHMACTEDLNRMSRTPDPSALS